MFKRRSFVSLGGIFAAAVAVRAAAAQSSSSSQSQPPAQKDKNLAIGEAEAKRMLLLMDKDKNGKVSKAEFMAFMEAEFDRLDKNKDGELDVKELTGTQVRIGGAISR